MIFLLYSGLPEIPIHGDLFPPHDDPETNTTPDPRRHPPQLRGVVGLQVPRCSSGTQETVRLFAGARKVLYELATNPLYQHIVLATASSSLEPTYSYACLEMLEILPNVTVGDLMTYNQIGRTGPLSPDKITHFQQLRRDSQGTIPYKDMLFFDDWYVSIFF